ncbi:PP0621 family protein [Polaromonas sp.]|uniref:PP0621 family protein n=1 Tax=Polaromonas sp. TaxID=1869339 RepID=UPI0032666753
MKYLIVIVLALVVVWIWRSNRQAGQPGKPPRQAAVRPGQPAATEVVACAVCAVHLPRADALPGGQGLYCSDAHRRQAEGG